MHSLQVKFSVLVAVLLMAACATLAFIAIRHERRALESEVERRGSALTEELASAAAAGLRAVERGDPGGEAGLARLVGAITESDGVAGVRLLTREGRIAASAAAGEHGARGTPRSGGGDDTGVHVERRESLLAFAAPIRESGVRVGEAQIELDPAVLVEPVVDGARRQLTMAGVALLALGVLAGTIFAARLVGPLKRLRKGVGQMSVGDVMVRVPPTSHDEVGQLTRAFNEMGDSLAQKQRVQNAFGRYVDDYVLKQLLESAEGEQQTGIEREVTILFADVRSFTRLSEGMKAPDVVALLNEVFQLLSDRILEQGGTIDKFIGDSVMAYFGAPVPHPDHALRAVNAAVQIIDAMAERNRGGKTPGDPKKLVPAEVGIGVHTGNVVVGTIGSDRRADFTAVGDAVNVAHRIEKLAPPGGILVSEAVQRRVRGALQLRFEGERQLSGREEPVHVYAVALDTNRH
jgi:class 3 adenylate cyclase